MFCTQETARVIREKRIEKNMTQMQLADALGISYQAVSNWERGNSMPDISKLGELAEMLGCTVEDILGNSKATKTITKVINNDTEELQMDIEELEDIAPILPPRETESILGEMLGQAENIELSDLCGLAPFLPKETLEQFVENLCGETCPLGELAGLAPFLSKETLNRLVKKAMKGDDFNFAELCGLAPFLPEETLDAAAAMAIEANKMEEVAGLAPFLSKQTLQHLAEAMVKNGGLSSLSAIAPFLR